MIHIAPCSCELHQALREALERNRELEAELETFRTAPLSAYAALYARAEKAAELNKELYDSREEAKARAEKVEAALRANIRTQDFLQARVAEYEQHCNAWCECGLGLEHDLPESWKMPGPWRTRFTKPAPATVGDETPSQGVHEREEC